MNIKDPTFFEAIRDFINIYLPKQRLCSPCTVKSYDLTLNLFLLFLKQKKKLRYKDMSFENLNYQTVCGFLDWLNIERNCGANTQNHHLMVIRSFSKYASILSVSYISAEMEIEKIHRKKVPPKIVRHFSLRILKAILAEPDKTKSNGYRDCVFMSLMYDSAARCQEMLDLQIENLRLNCNSPVIYITGKGGKTRPIPLMPKTALLLKTYLTRCHPVENRKDNDFVFFTIRSKERVRMSESNVGAFVKRYGQQAKQNHPELNIPDIIYPHMFRHSRAMHIYADGIHLHYISEFLGHEHLSSTQIYAHSDSEMKRAMLAKVRRLDPDDGDLSFDLNDDQTIKKLYGLRY
ncbi:MAG: tyrosine-type recombinase/integrase [Victivallaceae bacterium]